MKQTVRTQIDKQLEHQFAKTRQGVTACAWIVIFQMWHWHYQHSVFERSALDLKQ